MIMHRYNQTQEYEVDIHEFLEVG